MWKRAVLFLIVVPLNVYAQFRFDHWTTDNGLPQNSVRHIRQTRDGYIWVTTHDGLVRFDGVRFTIFKKSNSPGLASNRVMHLFEDRFGDLWSALETGGLVRRHHGRFTTFTSIHGIPLDYLVTLNDDGQGNLIVDWAGGTFRWQDEQFQPVDGSNLLKNRLPEEWRSQLLSPVEDASGNIWFSANDRLIRVKDKQVVQVYTQRDGLPGLDPVVVRENKPTKIRAMSRDVTGRIWITDLATMRSELFCQRLPDGMDNHAAYVDREGNFWFWTINNGLFRARRQTITSYGKEQGLNAREVYAVLEARDGSLWIGSWGEGLFRYKDGVFTQQRVSSSALFVTSLYEDHAGQLWVNGSNVLQKAGVVREPRFHAESLDSVWAMCQDAEGAYWLGSTGGVLRYHDGGSTHFTTKDGLAGNDTKVIIPDAAGGVWFGSYGGLTHRDRNGRLTAWTEKDGLPGNTVRTLKLDDDGTLWIGTYDSGLGRFKDGRFTRYTGKNGLYDDGVFQILEDNSGWFWMSCNRGIYRVRKQELNDFALGKTQNITSISYNKSDGMLSAECNGGRWPSGIRSRDGRLWFPTMEGIATIDPAKIPPSAEPPPVVIEEIRIENQSVPFDPMNLQSAIEMVPGQNHLEIEYTGLTFFNSENVRFKYRLEGDDSDWIDAGTRRTAYYSNVKPGSYVFKVIAANAEGIWNQTGASMRVRVIPPFYQRWWFLTLASLAAVGAILLVFRLRERKLRQEHERQAAFSRQLIESQEVERKRIATELHDSLGQELLVIKNWAMMGLGDTSNANHPDEMLNEISSSASRAIDEVREIIYDLRPVQLERIGLGQTIRFMLEKVAAASNINFETEIGEIDNLFSYESEITIYRIVQECVNNIVKHSSATEARVRIEKKDHELHLTIEDNGRGFALEPTAGKMKSRGLGLTGIAERVRMLGGTHSIQSSPGQGTRIQISFDLSGHGRDEGKDPSTDRG